MHSDLKDTHTQKTGHRYWLKINPTVKRTRYKSEENWSIMSSKNSTWQDVQWQIKTSLDHFTLDYISSNLILYTLQNTQYRHTYIQKTVSASGTNQAHCRRQIARHNEMPLPVA